MNKTKMGIMSLIIVFILTLGFMPSVFAFSGDGYSTAYFQNLTPELIHSEFQGGDTIYGFDVDRDGNCLLMTNDLREWYVNVYSSEGVFQYGVRLNAGADTCRAFFDEEGRISVLFVKSSCVGVIDMGGNLLSLEPDEDRAVAASLQDYYIDGGSAQYEIEANGKLYILSIPGLWSRAFRHAKRELTITEPDGSSLLVYQSGVQAQALARRHVLFPMTVAIVVAVALVSLSIVGLHRHKRHRI